MKYKRAEDPWKELRKNLFGNVEPTVELEAITMPIHYFTEEEWKTYGNYWYPMATLDDDRHYPDAKEPTIDWKKIEELPAIAAGVSYGSKDKMESDHERAIKLNKKLIEMGHHTPLEAIQLNLYVTGISKACGAQISRHRTGQGHVSASRRFKEAEPQFVYPILDYIQDEGMVRQSLKTIERVYEDSFEEYMHLKSEAMISWELDPDSGEQLSGPTKIPLSPLKKEDRRMVLPVSYATERTWWINVRALRDFFRLRLAADAEWEIRRLAWLIFDLVEPLLPSLFEDLRPQRIRYSSPSRASIVQMYRVQKDDVNKEFTEEDIFDLGLGNKADPTPSTTTIGTGVCAGCGKIRGSGAILGGVPCECGYVPENIKGR